MERSCRQQTFIEAQVEAVWALVGDPNRHPEWWPSMVEMDCAALEEGCRYRGVITGPLGRETEHELQLQTLDDCKEVLIHCDGTGVSTGFTLTEAQGGTFVEGRFAIEPQGLGATIFGAVAGRATLRAWLKRSLSALKQAAEEAPRVGA